MIQSRGKPATAKTWYSDRVSQPGSVVLNSWLAGRKSLGPTSTSFSLTDVALVEKLMGGRSLTGRNVTDEFALAVSAVWRCITLRAQTVGSLPWSLLEKLGPNEAREVDDHPLAEVLVYSPNANMDRMQFREALEANLALRGNAYSLKEFRKDGNVSSLTPIPTKFCQPRRNKLGLMEFVVNDRGGQEVYPSEKIWHVHGFGWDGLVGINPLGSSRNAIALAGAAEEFGSRFFGQGARASALLKIPQWLEDTERDKAKRNVNELRGGLDNAHRVELLEGGMEYQEISAKPGEAQHDELRNLQVVEICRFLGVPPHLAFDLRHGSYNNVETLAGEFVTFGLLPDIVRFELAAQRQLLKPEDRRRYFLRFNFEGLLRANSLERGQFYAGMLQNGVLSRNEVREKENYSRVDTPGMDDRTVQSNLVLTQFLEAMVKAGAATGRGDPQPGEKPK